jgi:protein phosphatase
MSGAFAYLESVELSDVGRRRKNNEDSVLRLPEAGVFCVADGMGGVQGGEVASKAAVDELRKDFTESPEGPFALTADASARLIERALNRASRWIKDRADSLGLAGTGSTAVVLAFDQVTPACATVLHAGDSRAYRYRGEKLTQLMTDHSVAAAAGLSDESSLPAMFRGVVTRAVGIERRVQLDQCDVEVLPRDLFLLCSDGLSKMLGDRQIQKLIRRHERDALPGLAKVLVDAALDAGGADNVSVVLVRVGDSLPRAPTREIPPETVAIEKMTPPPEDSVLPPLSEHPDETGETANSAAVTNQTQPLPATPSNGRTPEGSTPMTPHAANGAPGPVTPPTPPASPASGTPLPAGPGRGFGLGLGILLLAALLALAAWFLTRQTPGLVGTCLPPSAVTPGDGTPAPVPAPTPPPSPRPEVPVPGEEAGGQHHGGAGLHGTVDE